MFSKAYVIIPFLERFAQLLDTMLVTLYTAQQAHRQPASSEQRPTHT